MSDHLCQGFSYLRPELPAHTLSAHRGLKPGGCKGAPLPPSLPAFLFLSLSEVLGRGRSEINTTLWVLQP